MDTYKGSVLLGAHLRHHRKRLGLTQKAAAERIGVSQSQWSRWEDAKLMPDPIEDFPNLARFLELDEAEVHRLAFGITDQATAARLDALEEQIRWVVEQMQGIAEGDAQAPGLGR